MYVTSRGVTETNPRESGFDPFAEISEHAQRSYTPSARRNIVQRANSFAGLVLIGAIVLSSGLAYAIRTRAGALNRPSLRNFGTAQVLGNPDIPADDEAVSVAAPLKSEGYWIATRRGRVYPFGNVQDYGSIAPFDSKNDIIKIIATPTGEGYWLLAGNGNVYTFGDAKFHGTPERLGITGKTFVSLLPSIGEEGYTLVQDNGDTIAFGAGQDYGSAVGQLGGDIIVDAQALRNGKGYFMVSSKGAVFAFGDAIFSGSISSIDLLDNVSAIALTDDGLGYWILTKNGGVYSFGDVKYYGNSLDEKTADTPSIDMAISSRDAGYWILDGKAKPKPAEVAVKTANASVMGNTNADNADVWARLRNCESHGNYQTNTGNGYYGAYQFSAPTWNSMNTGYAYAHEAPPEVQDDAARRLQARSGWGQWPVCSRNAGAR